ncbi:MAG: hypothetical protein ACHRHE_23695 [Tepidisphaerales bacterium]
MKRRIFTILSALSLLWCVAVAAAAIHWYWTDNDFGWRTDVHQYERGQVVSTFHFYMDIVRFVIPFWLVLPVVFLPATLLPLEWHIRSRRWRIEDLRRQGHCTSCGYDLRATPERCPECGAESRREHAH